MSNPDNNSDTPAPRHDADRTSGRNSGRNSFGSVLALLLSLAAVSLSAYVWYTLAYQHADLYSQSIPDRIQELRTELGQLKVRNEEAAKSISELRETQKVLADATRKTYSELGKTRNKWAISEIEQLLIIANQRIQLAHDFETAAIALQAADSRLQALADPTLTPVRKQLAKEINRVKSIDRTDLSGLALRLASLIDSVEELPLSLNVVFEKQKKKTNNKSLNKSLAAKNSAGNSAAPPSTPGFFAELWEDIKGLVNYRDNSGSYKPLLPPQQQYFLRENLRLLLLGAQQALLRNESDIYIHNLKSAKRWVNQYFDSHTQAIRHLNTELDALANTKLILKSPDISGSLKLLRKITNGNNQK